MKNKKGTVGLIVVACILSVLVVVCIIIIVYLIVSTSNDNKVIPGEQTQNDENTPTLEGIIPADDMPEEVKKLDEAQGWIFEKEIDLNGAKYKVPVINLTTKYATKANTQVEESYKDKTGGRYVIYSYYIYSGVLALILDNNYSSRTHMYEIYNVNLETGKQVTNKEILEKANITEVDLISRTKTACENKYKELYKEATADANYQTNLDKTLKDVEKVMEKPMHFDHNGNLFVTVNIYQLAGAETNQYLIEI